MAEKLDEKEVVTFKEMLMANSIQVDAVGQLQIEKEIIVEEELYTKLKKVERGYGEIKGSPLVMTYLGSL